MTDVNPDEPADPSLALEPDSGAPKVSSSGSGDSRRLVIALVALALVAVTAVGFGVVRKKSTTDASTTPTSAAPLGSATTEAGTATTVAGTNQCQGWTKASYTKSTPKDAGVYLSNDTKWHLRVVSLGGAKTFAGMITASNNLEASTFKLSDPKAGSFTVKGNTATFELKGADAAAGLDFSIPCKAEQFSVAITADGQAWPTEKITIGKDTKAVSNPVIFTRRP